MFGFFRRKRNTARKLVINTTGDHYNLKELYEEINTDYFQNELSIPIMWSGSKSRIPKTCIRLGSYDQQNQLIRINRLLDQAHIPRYFVSFIIYHEMLHHIHPPKRGKKGRRDIHHREFKEREKEFIDYSAAKKFKDNLKMDIFKETLNNSFTRSSVKNFKIN